MPKVIDSFSGDYTFLSNFWLCTVVHRGYTFHSVEHAYQAAKTKTPALIRWIQSSPTPGVSKRRGPGLELRSDWEQIKVKVMNTLVGRKFQNPSLRKMLLATGDATLIEGNWWGDTFWGVCKGSGKNYLGRILMYHRNRISQGK